MYQLIVSKPISTCIWCEPNRKPGDVIWVRSMQAARQLLELGLCKWPDAGPQERAEFAPGEHKDGAPLEGVPPPLPKSSAGPQAGRLTGSQLSIPYGERKRLSASAAALVLPKRL